MYQMDYKKGLFFKNGLELERALCLLREFGFELGESVESMATVEAMMRLENERLGKKYQTLAFEC